MRTEKGSEGRRQVNKLYVQLRHSLPLKTFIPSFLAFIVLLGIAFEGVLLYHYRKTEVHAGHCFLRRKSSNSREVDIVRQPEIANQPDFLI